MSNSKLPERASLEYLKKLAKDRLQELRLADPRARLATALLAVAREHGFSSWRALKAEVEQRKTRNVSLFFEACDKGDVEALGGLLANDDLYQLLKSRRLEAAQTALAGAPADHDGIEFEQDIDDMFYGARQFGIRDLNGHTLYFIQSVHRE